MVGHFGVFHQGLLETLTGGTDFPDRCHSGQYFNHHFTGGPILGGSKSARTPATLYEALTVLDCFL